MISLDLSNNYVVSLDKMYLVRAVLGKMLFTEVVLVIETFENH